MSPDPYSGSYDFSNPQSFNRYAYAGNNPLSFTDPSGLFHSTANGDDGGDVEGGCDFLCDILEALEGLFGGGPQFHGSLKPRPAAVGGGPEWDGNFGESLGISTKVPQGNWGIATALGLPDAGCEFGTCSAGPMGVSPDDIELHHGLPQAFQEWFEEHGIEDIENYVMPLTAALHRLKPNGIHTNGGGNWNRAWKQWMDENPNAGPQAIENQLRKMIVGFGIGAGDAFSDFFITINPCTANPNAPFCPGSPWSGQL